MKPRTVNVALKHAMAEAEQRLLSRFGEVTIDALSRPVAIGRPG